MITVNLSDAEMQRALSQINRYSKKTVDGVKRVIEAVSWDITKDAKQNCVVGRMTGAGGRLRASIRPLEKQPLYAKVGTDVDYAPYVEFGTGTMVDVPAGLEEYAIQFKGKGIRQVNLPARPYLFPAVEKNRKKFIDNIKRVMRDTGY